MRAEIYQRILDQSGVELATAEAWLLGRLATSDTLEHAQPRATTPEEVAALTACLLHRGYLEIDPATGRLELSGRGRTGERRPHRGGPRRAHRYRRRHASAGRRGGRHPAPPRGLAASPTSQNPPRASRLLPAARSAAPARQELRLDLTLPRREMGRSAHDSAARWCCVQPSTLRHALRLLLALERSAFLAMAAFPTAGSPTHLKSSSGSPTTRRSGWRQDGIVGVHRDLRLMAVRVTVPGSRDRRGRPGCRRSTSSASRRMIQLNDRVVLAVYNAPRTRRRRAERNQYCAFLQGRRAAHPLSTTSRSGTRRTRRRTGRSGAARRRTGRSSHAATTCFTRRPAPINVISSTASRHDPAGFIFARRRTYRAVGRTRPLFDTFGHNPYPENSAEPPCAVPRGHRPDRRGRLRDADERPPTAFDGHGTAGAGQPRRHDLVRRGRLPDRSAARQAAATTPGRENDALRAARRRDGRRRPGDATAGRDPARLLPAGGLRLPQLRVARRGPARRLAGRAPVPGRDAQAVVRRPSRLRSPKCGGETRTARKSAAHRKADARSGVYSSARRGVRSEGLSSSRRSSTSLSRAKSLRNWLSA